MFDTQWHKYVPPDCSDCWRTTGAPAAPYREPEAYVTRRTSDGSNGEMDDERTTGLHQRGDDLKDEIRDYVREAGAQGVGWAAAEDLVIYLIDDVCWGWLETEEVALGEPGWALYSAAIAFWDLLTMAPERAVLCYDKGGSIEARPLNVRPGGRRHARLAATAVDTFLTEAQPGSRPGNGPGLDMLAEHWSLDVEPAEESP